MCKTNTTKHGWPNKNGRKTIRIYGCSPVTKYVIHMSAIILKLLIVSSNLQAQSTDYSYEKIACMAHEYMDVNGFHGHPGDKYHPFFEAYLMMDFRHENGSLFGSWSELWTRRSHYIKDPVHLGIKERPDYYVIVFRAQYLGRVSDTFCVSIGKEQSPKPHMGSFGCLRHFGLESLDPSEWDLKFRDFDPDGDCALS